MNKIAVAIDGFSGCGKSSTARELAKALNYLYIDSGAMYRGVTYLLTDAGIDPSDHAGVSQVLDQLDLHFETNEEGIAHLHNGNQDLEPFLRTMDVNNRVSEVSAIPEVRTRLVRQQQELGKAGGIVMDGRDIGTVVFPDAELKLFLTADLNVRAERRKRELEGKGINATLDEIIRNFNERDKLDSKREVSPLTKAKDAIELDTSFLTFEEQINRVLTMAEEKIYGD
ncbi:MAG: (d)CMP kinase [Cytophagales bacterium]|nr:(d)CMP kinase [Cytophagales bacterium]